MPSSTSNSISNPIQCHCTIGRLSRRRIRNNSARWTNRKVRIACVRSGNSYANCTSVPCALKAMKYKVMSPVQPIGTELTDVRTRLRFARRMMPMPAANPTVSAATHPSPISTIGR